MRELPDDAVTEPTFPLIPDTAYVQVCREIMPEAVDKGLGIRTIPERFQAVTRRLPLNGAGVMRMIGEELALTMLLTMIERGTAAAYYDKCLMSEIDLSYVNWVFTANTLATLPAPLLSRVAVIEVAGPNKGHFPVLLADVLESLSGHWGVPRSELPDLHPVAERAIRKRFVRHRSTRLLARDVEQALAAVVPLMNQTNQ